MPGVPGSGGPPPKRGDQRRRRNKPEVEVSSAPSGASTVHGSERHADPQWHDIAKRYWDAFTRSGQTEFWEPSDWAQLYDAMDDLSQYKRRENRSAVMRSAIDAQLARLLTTEGDRRRMRIELARADAGDADEDASVTAIAEARGRFTG